MRRWLYLILMVVFFSQQLLAAEDVSPSTIHVVSEIWEDYTNADGTGYGWELLRKIFEPAGVTVQIESVPYTRAVGLVQRGEADAWLGAYRDEVDGVIFPRWHYDADPIVALGLATSPKPSLETLGIYRLIWLRGYDFQDQLANAKTYQEIRQQDTVLEMLKAGRADFYLDVVGVTNAIASKATDPALFQQTELIRLPIYVGFAPNARGRVLAALFDQRMEKLVASGELRPIFEKWNEAYPFVKELRKPYGAH
mgnify:CR=1 FL=1